MQRTEKIEKKAFLTKGTTLVRLCNFDQSEPELELKSLFYNLMATPASRLLGDNQ